MRVIISVLIIALSGCIHTKINRVNPHERSIVVCDTLIRSLHRSMRHLKYKADTIGCKDFKVIDMADDSCIIAACEN